MSNEAGPDDASPQLEKARALLTRVQQIFATKPFRSHRVFQRGHAQTIAAYAGHADSLSSLKATKSACLKWRRALGCWLIVAGKQSGTSIPPSLYGTASKVQPPPINMQAIAEKGSRAGFNVIRVNFRNCGGTEHLTSTIYHGGLSADLAAVVKELIERDHISRLLLVGFSLGGNLVLNWQASMATIRPGRFSAFVLYHHQLI